MLAGEPTEPCQSDMPVHGNPRHRCMYADTAGGAEHKDLVWRMGSRW